MAASFTDWEGTCLVHHGIKGQKWGVRRYQNPDGTLTPVGKKHEQKMAYKEFKRLGKTLSGDDFENSIYKKGQDIVSKRAKTQVSKIGRTIRRDAIANLQGRKEFDERGSSKSSRMAEQLTRDLLGKYYKKRIKTGKTSSSSALRAVYRTILSMADNVAFKDGEYEKLAKKYSKKT